MVERISPVVDPATSTVRLTLLLDGRRGRCAWAASSRCASPPTATTTRWPSPRLALVEEGALRSVFVAEADTVRKVEIDTGLYDETHVEILEGLFEGDFVVTMGQGGLRTGTRIEALNAEAVGYAGPSKPTRSPPRSRPTLARLGRS